MDVPPNPVAELQPWMDVAGVIVTGRVGFSNTFANLSRTQRVLKHGVVHRVSPYWHQALTAAVKIAMARKPKYLLFFDGDGAWTKEDIERLYWVIERDERIDSVVPVQAGRLGAKPLAYDWKFWEPTEYDYTKPTTKIIHGHFGLTLIRSKVFETLPEPWFWDSPATDGSWDTGKPGKIDSDTYFWVKLYEQHKTTRQVVVQANQIVVGHMEEMILWQAGKDVVVQSVSEFCCFGKPEGLRNPTQEELKIPKVATASQTPEFNPKRENDPQMPKEADPTDTQPVGDETERVENPRVL